MSFVQSEHKLNLAAGTTLAPSPTLLLYERKRAVGDVATDTAGKSSGCSTILRALSPRSSSMSTMAALPRSASRTGSASAAASPDSTLRSLNSLRDALPSSSITSSNSSLATTSIDNHDDYGGSSSHSSHTQMAHPDPTSANAVAGPSNLARTPSPSHLQSQRYQNVHTTSLSSPAAQPLAASPTPRNPLIDLIETEHAYVDDLAVIIKKVAAAWSRNNFPPPALDKLFRAIEAVYRVNKAFLVKLNEIGPNPSSPKALGDLLMRWVDDLEAAYTKYVNSYQLDFDYFEPVQSNVSLAPILQSLPPPRSSSYALASATSASGSVPSHAKLDILFALPAERIEYYKGLYAKLLRSTQPGKSDHGLLVSANEKLDWLLQKTSEAIATRSVISGQSGNSRSRTLSTAEESSTNGDSTALQSDPRQSVSTVQGQIRQASLQASAPPSFGAPPHLASLTERRTSESNASGSAASSVAERSSGQTTNSSLSTAPSYEVAGPIKQNGFRSSISLADIERSLDTSVTLDIFTMRSKRCKLQIAPPGLTFNRQLRHSGHLQISFIPRSDPSGQLVHSPHSFIYLLTDLFLICERIPEPISAQPRSNPYAELYLKYPPLATKHLKAFLVDDQEGAKLEVEIMRKERLTLVTESRVARDEWLAHLQDAIAFQSSIPVALRVDTDTQRIGPSPTPSSVSGGGRTLLSPLPGAANSSNHSAPVTLPPLPQSATRDTLASPMSTRSPAPNETFGGRASPYQNNGTAGSAPQSAYPLHASPSSTARSNQLSPRSQQPLLRPPPPQVQSPQSGMVQSPDMVFHDQNLPPIPGSMLRNPHPGQHFGVYGPHSLPLPPMPGHPMQEPHFQSMPLELLSHPSTRSVASHQSRTSRSNTVSSQAIPGMPAGLPGMQMMGNLPPLPFKDHGGHLHHPHPQQAFGMPPEMHNSRGYMHPPHDGEYQPQPMHRSRSADGLRAEHYRMPSSVLKDTLRGNSLPSAQSIHNARRPSHAQSLPGSRMGSGYLPNSNNGDDDSPPGSPTQQGPVMSTLAAQMKCKVFIQQNHGQWKSLGTAKLKLYLQSNQQKQLVVEDKQVLISTMILEDGVERVGKTGVAVEISDKGSRTGIIYMLQLKTEQSAIGLHQQLLLGSSRSSAMALR